MTEADGDRIIDELAENNHVTIDEMEEKGAISPALADAIRRHKRQKRYDVQLAKPLHPGFLSRARERIASLFDHQ